MAAVVHDRVRWAAERDKDSHRDYEITWLVEASSPDDGPQTVSNATAMPLVGSQWTFGNDNDLWAYCLPTMKIRRFAVENEPDVWWLVDQIFSTRPLARCQDEVIENPLDEPPQLSGSFVKYTKEAIKDRNGNPFKNSSHERLKGKILERDYNRPTVKIAMNMLTQQLATYSPMIDTVNDAPLWGLSERMIKLSNAQWTRKLYGTCTFYYTVEYEFDIDFDTFDRKTWDEGSKILVPGGDPTNPAHFQVFKDIYGENTRIFLDGAGNPLAAGDPPVELTLEFYDEANFLLLGIPGSL